MPELPAESCAEIKASEGENAVSGNYWFVSIIPGEVIQASCIMEEGIEAVCLSVVKLIYYW